MQNVEAYVLKKSFNVVLPQSNEGIVLNSVIIGNNLNPTCNMPSIYHNSRPLFSHMSRYNTKKKERPNILSFNKY